MFVFDEKVVFWTFQTPTKLVMINVCQFNFGGKMMLRSLKISLIVLFNFTSFCDDHFIETLGEAASGEPRAQFELGLHYFNGDEVIQDYTQAVKWWKRSAANGNSQAMYELGVVYQKGLGVPIDFTESVKWFITAAEHDHSSAVTQLGIMYEIGQGVVTDHKEAIIWFDIAAKQGNKVAQYRLAMLHFVGILILETL